MDADSDRRKWGHLSPATLTVRSEPSIQTQGWLELNRLTTSAEDESFPKGVLDLEGFEQQIVHAKEIFLRICLDPQGQLAIVVGYTLEEPFGEHTLGVLEKPDKLLKPQDLLNMLEEKRRSFEVTQILARQRQDLLSSAIKRYQPVSPC